MKHHSDTRRRRDGAGFTLIELMLTIAISGIITAIVFTGLRNEQSRSAAKDAADRLQVELLGLQNKIQSAVALPTKYCTRGGGSFASQGLMCIADEDCLISGVQGRCISGPPAAYGVKFTTGASVYDLFADMAAGTVGPDGKRDFSVGSNDQAVATGKSLGKDIVVHLLLVNTQTTNPSSRVDITFGGNNSRMTINKEGGSSPCIGGCTKARIVLRNTVSNVCYDISVNRDSGIVSKRQFNPTCT